MKQNLKFEEIIDDLKQGKVATRAAFNNSIFVFMRLSVAFQQDDLDKLNHAPPLLLQIAKQREHPLVDGFHLCILFPDNIFYPFIPSTIDLFVNDWAVLDLEDVNQAIAAPAQAQAPPVTDEELAELDKTLDSVCKPQDG